jgi:arylsulfatase A-like enzyme
MPTLMGLLGVAPPDRVTGRDVWPLVTGDREPLHDEIVTAYGSYAGIRTERWNYIAAYKEPDPPVSIPPRLYDLTAELVEETDVSAEHPDVLAHFAARLAEIVMCDA